MTKHKKIYEELTKPFTEKQIKFRIGSTGYTNGKAWALLLAYVDSRDIEQRLDDVLGFENWEDEYIPISYQDKKNVNISGYICNLTINIDGKKITKSNSAEMTAVEGIKGGCSKALVRTASRFGIGRHLYDFKNIYAVTSTTKTKECPNYIQIEDKKTRQKHNVYWGIDSKKVIKQHLNSLSNYTNNWKDLKPKYPSSKKIIKVLFERYNKDFKMADDFLKPFKTNLNNLDDLKKVKLDQLALILTTGDLEN